MGKNMLEKRSDDKSTSKQASYETLQERANKLELTNRKLTRECEKLKQEIADLKTVSIMIDNNRYKHALDEIEKYTKTTLRMPLERRVIHDIIREAKGEE